MMLKEDFTVSQSKKTTKKLARGMVSCLLAVQSGLGFIEPVCVRAGQ